MHRIMVLGAGGMLGHKLCQVLGPREECEVIGTVRRDAGDYARCAEVFGAATLIGGVDVLDDARLDQAVREARPDAIVNCVGIVKQLDQARDRYLSVAINAYLPHRLARLCEALAARLIHISTDCVFDGTRGGYTEADGSDARDLYGKSKYLGETDAAEPVAVTLRTSLIGRELRRPTHGLVEWFLAQRGKTVRGFARAIYTGLTTLEMARIVVRLVEGHRELAGLYHVAGPAISKYDLLQLIRRVYELPITIERDEDFQCDRSLLMGPFAEATGYVPPSWEEMIRQMHEDPTPYEAWRSEDESRPPPRG